MKELKNRLAILKERFRFINEKTDQEKTHSQLRELEAESLKSSFWEDVNRAQSVMQQISDLRGETVQFEQIEEQIETLTGLLKLPELEIENLDLKTEVDNLEKELNDVEKRLFLSGKYDAGNCFLSVHAGQGGVDAMDWAAMVLRMYQRYAEKKGWGVTLVDEIKGEEAGIKSTTLEIKGRFAYGLLKKESGTHRLVRLSPFNADSLRQTSFALVEVLPVIEDTKEVGLNETDLEFDMFRSSGPGGQNVQKVSTAVRVKHLPTGITVSCQSERSQYQNKENALKILASKIFQIEEEKRRQTESALKDWQKTASWGTQIRSYVIHPYKQVKDLRTGHEETGTEEVLNGEIDGFIEAEMQI